MEAIFVGQLFDLDVLGERFALSLELLDFVAAFFRCKIGHQKNKVCKDAYFAFRGHCSTTANW
jgi:hypothetical protein